MMATKFVKYEDVRAASLAAMTPEERKVYDEAHEHAGVALRLAELFYETRTWPGLARPSSPSEWARVSRSSPA